VVDSYEASTARPTLGPTATRQIGGVPMGAPVAISDTSVSVNPAGTGERGQPMRTGTPATANDLLAGFGPIVAAVAQREQDSAHLSAQRLEAAQKFLDDFATACERQVKPAMKAVLEQLRHLGGGGLIEEHPGGEARFAKPRIGLWMSFDGEVEVPRPDRYPYLSLEADVESQKVQVEEGDMWRGAGGNVSGRAGTWQIPELTGERIVEELLEIAQRAAR
jgi:hypothetical protein